MENILEVKNLEKSYEKFKLKKVSFTVPKGTIVGFIGENGAGKTTTIKLILDILKKDSGEIKLFNGTYKRDDIGVVLDNCTFQENLTANEVKRVIRSFYERWDEEVFLKVANTLKLPLDKKIKELSKGNKMKLALSIALSHNAKLLIIDEGTSGLDPVIRDKVLDLLLEFIQDENNGVLISSHIISDLEKACDYITFIHNGEILLNEEKDILKEKYGVFNGSLEEIKSLPKESVIKVVENKFSAKALVLRDRVKGINLEKVSIEEIMLYYIK